MERRAVNKSYRDISRGGGAARGRGKGDPSVDATPGFMTNLTTVTVYARRRRKKKRREQEASLC